MGTTVFLIGCGFTAAVSIPLIMKIVPPNRTYGFRTVETLSDRGLWFRANHFAGWALLFAAAVSAFLLTFVPEWAQGNPAYAGTAFSLPLLIAVGASFAYLRRHCRMGNRIGQ